MQCKCNSVGVGYVLEQYVMHTNNGVTHYVLYNGTAAQMYKVTFRTV